MDGHKMTLPRDALTTPSVRYYNLFETRWNEITVDKNKLLLQITTKNNSIEYIEGIR